MVKYKYRKGFSKSLKDRKPMCPRINLSDIPCSSCGEGVKIKTAERTFEKDKVTGKITKTNKKKRFKIENKSRKTADRYTQKEREGFKEDRKNPVPSRIVTLGEIIDAKKEDSK